jgi:hypothetical protein
MGLIISSFPSKKEDGKVLGQQYSGGSGSREFIAAESKKWAGVVAGLPPPQK